MSRRKKSGINRIGDNDWITSSIDVVDLHVLLRTLVKRVERLEDGNINEWKVTQIVFIVLGALGVLVGIIIAILSFTTA